MTYCKSLIILNEIKKPTSKLLRIWAKNRLKFEMLEKIFKFTYENLNGKLIFTNFLYDFPGPLSFYTPLKNNTICLQQFFSVSGGGGASPFTP